MIFRKKLNLKKHNCDIKMRVVPYGGGWTDVYLDICGDSHYFIISNVFADSSFSELLCKLYHLYPHQNEPEINYNFVECETLAVKHEAGEEKLIPVTDINDSDTYGPEFTLRPVKATFSWDEELYCSNWTIERIPERNGIFMIRIHIEHEREETKIYDYEVPYKDFCYAVSKACTDMLKEYGFMGYHHSTYTDDFNLRHLLFLKSAALENFEAVDLTFYNQPDHGETSKFDKEMELLMFDM